MNKEIETLFVNKFIMKNRRERVLFELLNESRREAMLWKIYNLLDDGLTVFGTYKTADGKLLAEVQKYVADWQKPSYVIGCCCDDGQTFTFKKAFNNMLNDGGSYIIFYPNHIVVAKEMYEEGAQYKKILINTKS